MRVLKLYEHQEDRGFSDRTATGPLGCLACLHGPEDILNSGPEHSAVEFGEVNTSQRIYRQA